MLAVFEKSIAKSPEALQSPHSSASESVSALKDGYLANHFSSLHPASVTINLGSAGLLAYSVDKLNPLLPRFILYRNICLSLSRTVSASGENSVSYLCHNIFYLLLSQSNCWVMLHFLFCILLLLEIANFPFTEYFFFPFNFFCSIFFFPYFCMLDQFLDWLNGWSKLYITFCSYWWDNFSYLILSYTHYCYLHSLYMYIVIEGIDLDLCWTVTMAYNPKGPK